MQIEKLRRLDFSHCEESFSIAMDKIAAGRRRRKSYVRFKFLDDVLRFWLGVAGCKLIPVYDASDELPQYWLVSVPCIDCEAKEAVRSTSRKRFRADNDPPLSFMVVKPDGSFLEFIRLTLSVSLSRYRREYGGDPSLLLMHPYDFNHFLTTPSFDSSAATYEDIPIEVRDDVPPLNFRFV
jgi:hypothetical protein